MFKAPFSFKGRIRRMEYFLSFLLGGVVFGIAFALGVGTALFGAASNSGGSFGFGYLLFSIDIDIDVDRGAVRHTILRIQAVTVGTDRSIRKQHVQSHADIYDRNQTQQDQPTRFVCLQ